MPASNLFNGQRKPWTKVRIETLKVDSGIESIGDVSIDGNLTVSGTTTLPVGSIDPTGIMPGIDGQVLTTLAGTTSWESSNNIYENDGILANDRAINCNGLNMSFNNVNDFDVSALTVHLNPLSDTPLVDKFVVKDPISGLLSERDISSLPTGINLYDSDGTLTNPRTVDCDLNSLEITNSPSITLGATALTLSEPLSDTGTTIKKFMVRDDVSGLVSEKDETDIILDESQISPGTNGQVLTTVLGASSWADTSVDFADSEIGSGSILTTTQADTLVMIGSDNSTIVGNNATDQAVIVSGSTCTMNGNLSNTFCAASSGLLLTTGLDSATNTSAISTDSCAFTGLGSGRSIMSSSQSNMSAATQAALIGCGTSSASGTRLVVLGSSGYNATGNNKVSLGSATGEKIKLESNTGNVTCSGFVNAATLTGSLAQTNITPGTEDQILTSIGGVSTWQSTKIQLWKKSTLQSISTGPTKVTFDSSIGTSGVTYLAGDFTVPAGLWKITANVNFARTVVGGGNDIDFTFNQSTPIAGNYRTVQVIEPVIGNWLQVSLQMLVILTASSVLDLSISCGGSIQVSDTLKDSSIMFERT